MIAARNAARYAPFVALIESVDTGCAVALQRLLHLLWLKSKLAEIRKLVAAGS